MLPQIPGNRVETAAPPRVAIIGGINMDIVLECERVPVQGESLDSNSMGNFPGGKGANAAIAAYRASHRKPSGDSSERSKGLRGDSQREVRVFMNGAVGEDDFGYELHKRLKDEGIDVSGVQFTKAKKTGACVVLVEIEDGESRNIGYPGANLEWTPREPHSVTCFANGERPDLLAVHLDNPRERIEAALEAAGRAGVDTLLNPSPAYCLPTSVYKHVTHLVLNETEAATLSGRENEESNDPAAWETVTEYFLGLGVDNVVLTLGVQGAYYATSDGRKGLVPAVQNVKVMDSTGAGDTFIGMYSVEYVLQKQSRKWDIVKAIEHACQASAKTIAALGCQEAIPWFDEIDGELSRS